MAGTSRKEVGVVNNDVITILFYRLFQAEASPFVERPLRKGYEVLYLTDAVDEYTLQALPEYEGKKFQNIAKEGLEFSDEGDKDKKNLESMQESYKPLTKWLEETALKGMVREGY